VNRRVFLILSKSRSADVNAWDSPELEVRIEWEDFVSAAAGAIHFDPDPDTNMATLLTAGYFEMTGPGALNVSFDASIGTSADQLALLLASGLNLAGYNPQVSGGIVKFFPPIPEMVSFLAEGDGLEYASSWYMLGADGGEHR